MALLFSGGTDLLSRTTNLPSITSWSILCWARLDVDNNDYTTFMEFGSGSNSYWLGTKVDGTTLTIDDSNAPFVTVGALTLGVWYWLGVTCAGTGANQVNVSLNGALVATCSGSTTPTAGSIVFGGTFQGAFANLLVYSAVLTLEEQAKQRYQLVPFRTANLNSWAPLLTATAGDASVNGNGWTVGGTLVPTEGPPVPWTLAPPGRPSRRRLHMLWPS